ncbi:MAG: hypothetical protein HY021_02500 [Burkholderiales bacterium]|nr:hypothetical protein [Burkholderiales bacterium]
MLGQGYGSDTARVWYRGVPVAGADVASFGVIDSVASPGDGADAQDAQRRYRRGMALAPAAR